MCINDDIKDVGKATLDQFLMYFLCASSFCVGYVFQRMVDLMSSMGLI